MRLWQYDPDCKSDAMFIANWSDERARYYERETYRYLGVRPEPHYTWSRAYRPKKVKVKKPIRLVSTRQKVS